MDFDELLDQICDLLKRQGRVSYWALKRRFDLADDDIEGLKIELVEVQNLAADQDNKMLVWTEGTGAASAPISPPVKAQKPPPISYTPTYLTEKILTSRSALEGERKQVTVLFADLKDSTELIRDLDPEDAQKLLDPAIHIMMFGSCKGMLTVVADAEEHLVVALLIRQGLAAWQPTGAEVGGISSFSVFCCHHAAVVADRRFSVSNRAPAVACQVDAGGIDGDLM